MPTNDELKILQALPLELKILKTKERIKEWVNYYGEDNVYVSFSGGKDSTVLLDIARQDYPNMKAVFCDTGLEYPEIRKFAMSFENVDVLKPSMNFREVITTFGYPVFSKEIADIIAYARTGSRRRREKLAGVLNGKYGDTIIQFNKKKYAVACKELPFKISGNCCNKMKKQPAHHYDKQTGRKAIIATTTEESSLRKQAWLKNGCNAYNAEHEHSNPLSFWTEQDMLRYIRDNNIAICSVYGDIVETSATDSTQLVLDGCGKLACSGCKRTGCVFCLFAAGDEHKKDGISRFERLAQTHPKLYDYAMRGGQWVDNTNYSPCEPKYDELDGLLNWNPKKIFVPSNDGLGLKFVIDEINKLYGDFIRY